MKIYAYVALVVVLLAGIKWAHSTTYTAGWNAAIVEQTALIHTAQDEAVAKARTEWQNTADLAEKEIVVEERIVEVIRVIEKEIPKIVERIVEVAPECSDLGDDFAGLLNAQVNSGTDIQDDSASLTAQLDTRLHTDARIFVGPPY